MNNDYGILINGCKTQCWGQYVYLSSLLGSVANYALSIASLQQLNLTKILNAQLQVLEQFQ